MPRSVVRGPGNQHGRERYCQRCNRTFSKPEHLTRHLQTHRKEKPFISDGVSDSLRRHAKCHGDSNELGHTHQQSWLRTPQSTADTKLREETSVTVTMADLECFPTGSLSGFPNTPGSAAPGDFLEWGRNQEESTLPWGDVPEPDVSSAEDASRANPSVLAWPEFLGRRIESPVQEGSEGGNVSLGGDYGSFSPARDTNDYTEHCLSPMLAARNFATDNVDPRICLRIATPCPWHKLPDNDRLNLFANLYLTRFTPTTPFLHGASFQVTRQNGLLFLSMCAVGSQLTGRPHDIRIGRGIFDSRAFLSSSNSKDPFSLIYAGIVCTQFAIYSAAQQDLFLAGCLQGLITAGMRAIRRRQEVTASNNDIQHALKQGETLVEAWRQWAEAEQQARAYHAMRIHDVELATLLHHEPLSYSNLHSIRGQLIDARHSHTLDDAAVRCFSHMLKEWWQAHSRSKLAHDPDAPSLQILWHSSYISLYADCDLLERVLCRGERAQFNPGAHATATARSWTMSGDARICLVHAAMLQKHVEHLSLMAEPALHVSRALFQAGLVWLAMWRLATTHPGPANEAEKKGASRFKDN
ncbi:hypothetical protein BDV12DRAFT_208203 [Aspergillus spectabilis]